MSQPVDELPKLRRIIHFTFHAYGTWMPDREQGFYRNKSGIQEPDHYRADKYRRSMRESAAAFDDRVQRLLIKQCIAAAGLLGLHLFAVGTDREHLHLLVGWDGDHSAAEVQRKLKYGFSRRLNKIIKHRTWFTRQGHDKQVVERGHFVLLREEYLPGHPGWGFDRRTGLRPPRKSNR